MTFLNSTKLAAGYHPIPVTPTTAAYREPRQRQIPVTPSPSTTASETDLLVF